jgi:2-oxoglutarate dehydrogenase complex dehydrogenase (E1) component-like enzyme
LVQSAHQRTVTQKRWWQEKLSQPQQRRFSRPTKKDILDRLDRCRGPERFLHTTVGQKRFRGGERAHRAGRGGFSRLGRKAWCRKSSLAWRNRGRLNVLVILGKMPKDLV